MSKNHRKNLFKANKYEQKIIILPLFSTLILCTVFTIIILFLQQHIFRSIIHSDTTSVIVRINKWATFFIIYIWIFFSVFLVTLFSISNNLVGGASRIINDLDKILTGNKTTKLQARKNDDLINELIVHVNKLIEKSSTN